MIRNIIIISAAALMVLQASSAVFAQAPADCEPGQPCNYAPAAPAPAAPAPAAPQGNIIIDFLNRIIGYLMAIGGALGVLLLIVAGFYFISAKGDERKLSVARTMVIWVLIGIAVIFMSRFLIGLIGNFAQVSPGYTPGGQ